MFTYLTQVELQDLASEFVLVLKKVYPRISIEFFDNPKSVKQLSRLNFYLNEFNIRRLAPRYFEEMIRDVSFGDWRLILQYVSRKTTVAAFVDMVRGLL